jgi:magnesium-transporting ATPase (P-type)
VALLRGFMQSALFFLFSIVLSYKIIIINTEMIALKKMKKQTFYSPNICTTVALFTFHAIIHQRCFLEILGTSRRFVLSSLIFGVDQKQSVE